MNPKGPIKRAGKFRIQSYLDRNSDVVIEACLQGQIRRWTKMNEQVRQPSRAEHVMLVENDVQLMDLSEYRTSRKKSYLLNTYLISNLALGMLSADAALIVFLRIYLTWSSHNIFSKAYAQYMIPLINLHFIYCLYIFLTERYKEAKMAMVFDEVNGVQEDEVRYLDTLEDSYV